MRLPNNLLRCLWYGLCLVGMTISMPAHAVELRVAVAQEALQLLVGSSTAATVFDEYNQPLGQLEPLQPLEMTAANDQVQAAGIRVRYLRVVPQQSDGLVFIGERWFRGSAQVYASGGRLSGINLIDIEAYLYGVIGAEMPSSWPIEALKSQAIAARTYALYNWQRRTDAPFDLGSDTGWQVYRGAQQENDRVRTAVDATTAQVLTFNGSVINALYHAASGGRTEDIKLAFKENLPYLSTVKDYDQDGPYARWQQSFLAGDLSKALGLDLGQLSEVRSLERTPSGRVQTLLIVGTRGSQVVKATDLRLRLGLKSTSFEVLASPKPRPSSVLSTISFVGRGFGHGLGLSQWGAKALAASGWNCLQILSHYYQGTIIRSQRL